MLENIIKKIIFFLLLTTSFKTFSQDNLLKEGQKIMKDLLQEPIILFMKDTHTPLEDSQEIYDVTDKLDQLEDKIIDVIDFFYRLNLLDILQKLFCQFRDHHAKR